MAMNLRTALVFGYQAARTANFAGEQFSLPILERMITGKKRELPPDLSAKRKEAFQALTELLKKDSANISEGLYPMDVLRPEAPVKHWLRYGRILLDGVKIARRRASGHAHEFDQEAEQYLGEVPEYFRRNFHFQTGGYLTRESAELYEHQVEILFAGGGDAMRRLILPFFKKKYPSGDGEGLHFLEIGAGTGRLSRFVKLAFPKARVTVTDLSWPYLEIARERLGDLNRIEFMQAAAEKLPFQDGVYDGVFSCFLFHELPEKIRHQVVREALRVMKPGGILSVVDSLQKNDAKEFSWAIEQFPRDFHEPFYKNYTLHSLEDLFTSEGLSDLQKTTGFLAKAVMGEKPL